VIVRKQVAAETDVVREVAMLRLPRRFRPRPKPKRGGVCPGGIVEARVSAARRPFPVATARAKLAGSRRFSRADCGAPSRPSLARPVVAVEHLAGLASTSGTVPREVRVSSSN